MKKEKYIVGVSGMHCASCAGTIEKKLGKKEGIVSASVNFASEKATVEYDAEKLSSRDIVSFINETGYKAAAGGKIIIKAVGMDSPHCAMVVEKALRNSEGIVSVVTDSANQLSPMSP